MISLSMGSVFAVLVFGFVFGFAFVGGTKVGHLLFG